MILALLLSLAGQDAQTAAPDTDEHEIVVRAVYGRTTMLFDKGADGKLRNCRVMVSSGSQKRDVAACAATPVCYFKTADEVTDCVPFAALEPVGTAAPKPAVTDPKVPEKFDLGVAQFKPQAPAVGPTVLGDQNRDTERQRVKLPALPKEDKGTPLITLTGGDTPRHD